jgi:hypothetical protein
MDHDIEFQGKRQFLAEKWRKIDENCDHTIEPQVTLIQGCQMGYFQTRNPNLGKF